MQRATFFHQAAAVMALVLASLAAGGCERTVPLSDLQPEWKMHAAVWPVERYQRIGWRERYNEMNARVKQGGADLIFIGDSLTQRWETDGAAIWEKYYGKRRAVNLGIGGDRTQHVLWRLENGNIEGISPKVAVVLIGTNNSAAGNSSQEIADGVLVICKAIRAKLPDTKILLLAIFPRGENPDDEKRAVNEGANAIFSRVRDGKMIHHLDIGHLFVEPDGTISKEIMPDFLHLSPRGYEIWAKAMEPTLAKLLGEK